MKLNKEQYRAAVHVNGPMLVLAGPGSGKTHLLVERIRMMIEENGILPENILVITFSKKAALQMQARFLRRVEGRSYPVTFGTFHAVFYHILQEHDHSIKRLITEEEQNMFVTDTLQKHGFSSGSMADEDLTAGVIGMISGYKNFGDDFFEKSSAYDHEGVIGRAEFMMIYDSYVRKVEEAGLIDFDDMILRCRNLLYRHEGILRKWQRIYRYFLVDEFQDINDAQYDVLRLLAGDEKNVFAVGDDDQSIYAFRGSRPQLMKKFLHQYPGCRHVTLTMNYRCREKIIGAADTLIRNNIDRLERPMQRHLPSKAGGVVEIVNTESTDVQAAYVCDKITELTKKYGYVSNDFAVLYRSAHCAVSFEKAAAQHGLGLLYADNEKNGGRAQKIRAAYMRAHEKKATRADYFLIMNNPQRGLSREALCIDTGNYLEDLKTYYADEAEKLEKVYELERMIECFKDPEEFGPDGSEEKSGATKRDGINVMTAHASKGLEFPVVFIIGLQEGLFPHYRNVEGSKVEEERRLMYVAMTRAKERLYICSVSTEHGKRASRFVAESMRNMMYISEVAKITRI